MIIMDKFEKRLLKVAKSNTNAVVIGEAFGNLEKVLPLYNTVFIIGGDLPSVKAKNLVFQEDYQHLNYITEVSVIIVDLVRIREIEFLKNFWQRNNSVVVIEGNDPIEREYSKPLYETGWGCTSVQGFFHVWEQLK